MATQRKVVKGTSRKPNPRPPAKRTGRKVTRAPVAYQTVRTAVNPRFKMTKTNGSVLVSHTEQFDYLVGSEPIRHLISPSNPALFPWLSGIAPQYESYLFRQLRFIFTPTCSTTREALVTLAVDYDASDVTGTTATPSAIIMASWESTVQSPPSKGCVHNSIAKNLNKRKTYFTNFTADVSFGFENLHDVGVFIARCDPFPYGTTFTAGILEVQYVIDLMTPQIHTGAGQTGGIMTLNSSNEVVDAFGLPNNYTWKGYNSGVVVDPSNADGFFLQRIGTWLISYTFATDTAVNQTTFVLDVLLTEPNDGSNSVGLINDRANAATLAENPMHMLWIVNVQSTPCHCYFAATGSASTVGLSDIDWAGAGQPKTSCFIIFSRIPPGVQPIPVMP